VEELQLLIVHSVSDVRQLEMRRAEALVPGPSPFDVEITIAKLKKYKSPGNDQIPVELIQAGGETLVSVIHKLIISGIRKNCLTSRMSLLFYQFTKWVIEVTEVLSWDITAINFIQNFLHIILSR
jgi:hypothetical protein